MTPASPVRDRARIGIIGAGFWAVSNHLPILKRRADVDVVGVTRLGKAELLRVQSEFAIPFGSEDYRELLDRVLMDGVIVASPHHLHAEHASAVLERGMHAMVEKPMSTEVAAARRIVDAATRAGRQILVPYGWNFRSYATAARDAVAAGRIGEVRHVVAQMATPIEDLMSGGQLHGTENEMFRPQAVTWADPKSGGYGWGQLVHLLGALFHIYEAAPRDVFALVGRSQRGTDLFDAATIRFESGATGVISGSASVPPGSPFQLDIRLFGTEGMLLLDVERERLWVHRRDGERFEMAIEPGDGAYSCVTPVEVFADICRGLPADNAGGAIVGLRSVQVVDAILRSAEAGAMVSI